MKAIVTLNAPFEQFEHVGDELEINYREDGSLFIYSFDKNKHYSIVLAEYSIGSWRYAHLVGDEEDG
jgi:hypothetical protein